MRKPTQDPPCRFEAPESASPMAAQWLREPVHSRRVEHDLASGETTMRIHDDFGARRILSHGLVTGEVADEVYRIHPDDPSSARVEIRWTQTLGRDVWQSRTEGTSIMWADTQHFHIEARLEAFEGAEQVFAREWKRKIPRDLV